MVAVLALVFLPGCGSLVDHLRDWFYFSWDIFWAWKAFGCVLAIGIFVGGAIGKKKGNGCLGLVGGVAGGFACFYASVPIPIVGTGKMWDLWQSLWPWLCDFLGAYLLTFVKK